MVYLKFIFNWASTFLFAKSDNLWTNSLLQCGGEDPRRNFNTGEEYCMRTLLAS